MSKHDNVLVVFFSRTGHTKTVAKALAKKLDANLIELLDKKSYKGILGFIKGGYMAYRKKSSPIEKLDISLANYDLVILCSPLWAGSITPAIRFFCNKYPLPQTAWLITCGDLTASVAHLPTPENNIRTIIKIKDKDISNNQYKNSLDEFLAML